MGALQDIAAERAVLSGLCRYGSECYHDVADILNDTTFTIEYNKCLFDCLKTLFKQEQDKIDVASIYSAAQEIGLAHELHTSDFTKHLRSMFDFPVEQKNVRKFAARIRKLEIARLLRSQLKETGDELLKISGDETVAQILGIAENAIFDFSSLLHDTDEAPKKISQGLIDYVNYLATNPVDQIGIPTGFPNYDKAIGGGLRKGSVNVIGARIKVGKSVIGSNMGYHIASEHNIPVLNMDTEMTYEDHTNRLLAMASECYIYDIETGKFIQKPGTDRKVKRAAEKIERRQIPYYHKSISGMPFEEQLATMRRWIVKEVGLDSEGKAKPCVIVYDYLKLMTSEGLNSGLQEYQLLGFMMTSLHNFAVRYKIPILMFIQLNRDGITKESSDAASGSDRIMWLCSNFTIFKYKSDEEIAQDGAEAGNRKLVPVLARHGAGMDDKDYINCYFRGAIAKVVEGQTKLELEKGKNGNSNESIEQSGGNYGDETRWSEGETETI